MPCTRAQSLCAQSPSDRKCRVHHHLSDESGQAGCCLYVSCCMLSTLSERQLSWANMQSILLDVWLCRCCSQHGSVTMSCVERTAGVLSACCGCCCSRHGFTSSVSILLLIDSVGGLLQVRGWGVERPACAGTAALRCALQKRLPTANAFRSCSDCLKSYRYS